MAETFKGGPGQPDVTDDATHVRIQDSDVPFSFVPSIYSNPITTAPSINAVAEDLATGAKRVLLQNLSAIAGEHIIIAYGADQAAAIANAEAGGMAVAMPGETIALGIGANAGAVAVVSGAGNPAYKLTQGV